MYRIQVLDYSLRQWLLFALFRAVVFTIPFALLFLFLYLVEGLGHTS